MAAGPKNMWPKYMAGTEAGRNGTNGMTIKKEPRYQPTNADGKRTLWIVENGHHGGKTRRLKRRGFVKTARTTGLRV